ncbi:MAG: TerB family tellurite resistance protein [Pseudomonadota bacterium]
MIGALKRIFSEQCNAEDRSSDDSRRLAAAALLVEVARADFEQGAEEDASMATLLRDNLDLSEEQVNELLEQAGSAVDQATSLYEFTRAINDYYEPGDKVKLISDLWRVAYADSSLDKYEEHIIRRVADLIYVPHEDFIRTKLEVRQAVLGALQQVPPNPGSPPDTA